MLPGGAGAPSAAPVAPAPPSVTLTIVKSPKGNTLVVQWANLPEDTVALDIFRSTKGKNNWSLWKSITLSGNQFSGGNAQFDIGNATFSNYSFYVEATGNGGNGGNGGQNAINPLGQNILWISSSTEPTVTTSTLPSEPENNGPQPSSTIPSENTPTSSPPSQTPPSDNTSSTPPPPPSGTPYYNPQIQISGYGAGQAGSFWVQHIDQKIEIGWQNLPPQTTSIVVLRGANDDGPWLEVLNQENPGPSGSYSIQIVDNTLNHPYYYEMQALAGSSVIATYGPAYLPPVGQ